MNKTSVTAKSLFDEEAGSGFNSHLRLHLGMADVIFGVDAASEEKFLIFGRQMLQRIVATGQSSDCQVLIVPLNGNDEELQKLLTLVRDLKGHDDYSQN